MSASADPQPESPRRLSPAPRHPTAPKSAVLPKSPTGITGLDEVTRGGLPRGRPTLVTGAPGAGKTLLGAEFLARGILEYGEPGVLLTFEESADDVRQNVASLGFDLAALEDANQLVIDEIHLNMTDIAEAGDYDLEGLFIRLADAVDTVGATRVVLDTLEVLFTALGDESLIRSELSRLVRWLKQRGLTTVVTGERGQEGQLTRFGIEEYVSDCVIVLDHRVKDEVMTRRLRVVKYRGSGHGTNEYPFLITGQGLQVAPIIEGALTYPATTQRVSTGVARLDEMVGGGIYRGSTLLISGSAGTGKTTLAAQMIEAACRRQEQALFLSFEESPSQLIRNMSSVGIDLGHWIGAGRLQVHAERASSMGLEGHLERLHQVVTGARPAIVALDAVGSLNHVAPLSEVARMVSREVDALKSQGITAVLTSLTHDGAAESSMVDVSSLIDTWLLLRNIESDAERNRLLFVIKSRGTAHSNQVREFVLTDHGAELLDVHIGAQGVMTGSSRALAVAEEEAAARARAAAVNRRRRLLERRASVVEAQVAALRAELAAEQEDLELQAAEEQRYEADRETHLTTLARSRGSGPAAGARPQG